MRFWYREDGSCNLTWDLLKPDGESQSSGEKMLGLIPDNSDYLEKDNPVVAGEWNHFAFSFNQRAFKGYVNGVRIAQGAVPLYDRLTNDGKIVSYAITFVKQGIAQSRLTPVGKGSHSPIAPNDTAEGRAKNRRVEFVKK